MKNTLTYEKFSVALSLCQVTLRLVGPVLSLLLVLGFPPAHAWGAQGHQVIAGLALAQLTPKVRIEVDRLLAQQPGETLISISMWADEHKNPITARWHYVNFPRGTCKFEGARDCPDGQCLTGAIEKQTAVCASNSPAEKRLNALKYLVHLVGDVYQPLHAGYADDRGGNQFQLQAFRRGTNLHALWDSGIINNMGEDVEMLTARLLARSAAQALNRWSAVEAAQQSCQIVSQAGFYPKRRVGKDYVERFAPILEQQLAAAVGALASLLNQTLE